MKPLQINNCPEAFAMKESNEPRTLTFHSNNIKSRRTFTVCFATEKDNESDASIAFLHEITDATGIQSYSKFIPFKHRQGDREKEERGVIRELLETLLRHKDFRDMIPEYHMV